MLKRGMLFRGVNGAMIAIDEKFCGVSLFLYFTVVLRKNEEFGSLFYYYFFSHPCESWILSENCHESERKIEAKGILIDIILLHLEEENRKWDVFFGKYT